MESISRFEAEELASEFHMRHPDVNTPDGVSLVRDLCMEQCGNPFCKDENICVGGFNYVNMMNQTRELEALDELLLEYAETKVPNDTP